MKIRESTFSKKKKKNWGKIVYQSPVVDPAKVEALYTGYDLYYILKISSKDSPCHEQSKSCHETDGLIVMV